MNTIYTFLMNSPWLGIISFILAAVLAALACYGLLRILIGSNIPTDASSFSSIMIARLGTLQSLILALMFAHEMADYKDISRVVTLEASAVSDIYNELKQYDKEDPESTEDIINLLAVYLESVLQKDRITLAEGAHLSHRTWAAYEWIMIELRDLQPTNEQQQELRAQMLADWDTVSEFRSQLEAAAGYKIPLVFWLVVIAGFFAVVIPCYVFSPKFANLMILSVFAALNGIVMYVILAVSNPFTGPGAIQSTGLVNLLEIIGSTARGI